MKRDLMNDLVAWKTHPLRMPLILQGARQVGKSWLVDEFGKSFPSFVTINFEKEKEARVFFSGNLIIKDILEKLSLYANQKIIPGETLLFLDECQECEGAIQALRYFKEESPSLHVIAAGSLLEFALRKIGVPVGRVQFLYLYPLSFGEYLTACGREDLRSYSLKHDFDNVLHKKMLEYLKNYMWLGGMPAVLSTWLNYQDPKYCLEMQDRIILAYRRDFNKYAKENQIENLEKVFKAIPNQLGKKFKYSHVDGDMKVYLIKSALQLLELAGIVHYCYHASGQHLPLGSEYDEKKFKVFFFDIGLAQRIQGLDLKEWVLKPLEIKYMGYVAEQLVAQEYIAYTSVHSPPQLFYWHREDRGSNAEVDFLFPHHHKIIPVEVKSGIKGGMKSLNLFLSTHQDSPFGLKISENMASKHGQLIEKPFYSLESWLKQDLVLKEK